MQDILSVRYLEIRDNRLVIVSDDLQFKLSEKYFKLFGASCGGEEKILSGDNVGVNEELVSFASGKEFSLLQTSSGKVIKVCFKRYPKLKSNSTYRVSVPAGLVQ